MKNVTLVITYHKKAYFFPYVKDDSIIIDEPIKNKSKLMRLLFRLPILSIISYGFKKDLKSANKVIIFDSAYNKWLGIYLCHKKRGNNHLYYWNPISKMYPRYGKKMVQQAKKLMPVYSFDHNDCHEYGIEYRPMVYSSDVKDALKTVICSEYDIFFLGWKKDRSNQIESIYNSFFKGRFKCLFILVGDEDRVVDDSIYYTTQRIDYSKYLEYVQNSKTILDIPQKGQEGLTIRNVECLFLNKKMITTNTLVKNYDFYNEHNILVLSDETNERMIAQFIKSNLEIIDGRILEKYDFSSWIDSFTVNT